eukprot:CAMPEP_0180150772 /NCGR_PEP_ID=MMETSP0986-20121125/21704_1 /TAXON_ID=697907 /ORGANISM="non described non described, Strain CCMP2293" /LENGTH=306 /DNA_ID=CAMNT_0022097883 /DNA_START=172 /DNA_END=1088 /DNA_ORIENTATION=+
MSEEIQYLHDEINKVLKEVTEGYNEVKKEMDKPKGKMKVPDKLERVQDLIEQTTKGKDFYANFRVELREILKDVGRAAYAQWETRGHAHHKALQALLQDLQILKTRLEAEARGTPGEKNKKDMNTWGATEIVEESKRIQDQDLRALGRAVKMVDSAETIAHETNIALKTQTEQMRNTNAGIDEVTTSLRRADKIIRDIGRRLATDKLIMCMVLLLILAILAIAILAGTGLLDQGTTPAEEIDCSFDFTQTTKACQDKRAAAAASADASKSASGNRRMKAAQIAAGGLGVLGVSRMAQARPRTRPQG